MAGAVIVAVPGAGLLSCGPTAEAPSPPPPVDTFDLGAAHQECQAKTPTQPSVYEAALNRKGPGWAGADLTGSIDLGNGRVLWLFGDTFVGEVNADGTRAPGTSFIRNSAILQDGGCFRPLIGGDEHWPSDWIPPPKKDEWFWPVGGVVEGDKLKLFLLHEEKVEVDGPSNAFAFFTRDVDLATFRLKDLKLLRVEETQADENRLYGVSVSRDAHHTYLWGTNVEFSGGKRLFVARAPNGQTSGRWEFWDGKAWSKDPATAHEVLPQSVSSVLSVIPHEGGWLAVSKKGEFLGKDLTAWWAPKPEGPWRELGRLGPATPPPGIEKIAYMATAHPTATLEDGGLLVSLNHNSLSDQEVFTNADAYGSNFRSVKVPEIPAAWKAGTEGPTPER